MAGTAGYVLVGGRSSRFGSDKAFLEWQGRPLAAWVAEQVKVAAGSITLVGNPEKYRPLGFPGIPDALSNIGPLAGLSAALEHSAAQWNLVVACDMPHMTVDFLEFLLATARSETAADLILPLDRGGRPEPLCAAYSKRCGPAIADAIERGVRKMTSAFANLRARELEFARYAAFDPDGLLFANLNTPSDLAGARAAG